jgi:hypothetical protein
MPFGARNIVWRRQLCPKNPEKHSLKADAVSGIVELL